MPGDWWTPADGERFKKLTDELGKQYAAYEAAPGVFINPDLTMGENIGDMSGLEVAYEAYKISLGGKAAPVIDGLTGDQRFFLAFAQAWRGEQRDDAIKTQVASDPHSPRRYRVIGPLRNLDAWYSAFNVQPGTKFYIPPFCFNIWIWVISAWLSFKCAKFAIRRLVFDWRPPETRKNVELKKLGK